jgi:hypothetical protein
MNKEFQRGKQLLAVVIAIVLLIDGLSFWLSRSVLLSWYHEASTQVDKLNGRAAQQLLRYFVELDQRNFLANQGITYALLILGLVILYLGYSWIRWLWCAVWLTKGSGGLLVAYLLTHQVELWPNLMVYGLVTSTLYVCCAFALLCLPSINTYLRTIRR